MKRIAASAIVVLLTVLGVARASDQADELMFGQIVLIRPGVLAKFVGKPPTGGAFELPNAANDPRTEGATLDILDTVGGGSPPMTVILPGAGWKGLGSPEGSKGYKYKGAGTAGDPCKAVFVKPTIVKFVCRGVGVTAVPPFAGDAGVVLTVGTDSKRYCALFGGTEARNITGLLLRRNAPAPAVCPIPPPPCCNGNGFHSFTTADAPGDCGDITQVTGMASNLACNGLYLGGGGNSVPLPVTVPDLGQSITAITSCTGQTATLGAATSAQTGSNRNCTEAGCFFGAPLALSTCAWTSCCVLNRVAAPASGTLDCSTGAETLDLSLGSVVYLTGDTATDPTATIPGIQPCPLCQAGTCIGGLNNGMACVAGTSDLGDAFPTSHDCPPDPMFNVGTLPIAFSLTTGTVTWQATKATNDTEVEPNQTRVFSGFCRDVDVTTGFTNPADKCWENGMAVGTPCVQPEETCEQRSNGAFGPNGGGNMTITAIGSASSILGGPAVGTLVSVFSVPPMFNATIDAAFDLPGPGAITIPGTSELCQTANPCP